ncbi:MAG TPA: M23 family metallopeptidase [Dehalococcoidia bacterium]
MIRPIFLLATLVLALAACGDDTEPSASPIPTVSATPSAAESATTTSTPAPSPTYWLIGEVGFPIDPQTVLGAVNGEIGARTVSFDGDGPTAYDYALNDQLSDDPDAANRAGWNCRTHVEYEGIAAVDFYIPIGTPVYSTTTGTATLYARSVRNDFDRYDIDREPYLGNPDRANAPYNPFPGPSAGLGVYVVVEGDGFVTEYGHLDLTLTAEIVPPDVFFGSLSAESDWEALFGDLLRLPATPFEIAHWEVRRGDIVGFSGDAGYSEAPHLHYTIRREGGPLLCPTDEPGFADGAWLFR